MFTNAKAGEETNVRFPDKFPEVLFSGYKARTIARLKRNLYGSKSAPKLWYNCFLIDRVFINIYRLAVLHYVPRGMPGRAGEVLCSLGGGREACI